MRSVNNKWLLTAISALTLAACGGSDDDHGHGEEEHHNHDYEVLVSQANSSDLALLEEGVLETLAATDASGRQFVLGDSGEAVAIINGTDISFALAHFEEEHSETEEAHDEEHSEEPVHLSDYTTTADQVISTQGHFALLDSGTTTFIPFAELENTTPVVEQNSASVTEVYPALILDEAHDLKLVFTAGSATVYEGTDAEAAPAANITCTNPSSVAQSHELVIMSCDEGVATLLVEETNEVHSFSNPTLTVSGTPENYLWVRGGAEVFVGFEADTKNYEIVTLNETDGTLNSVSNYSFADNLCHVALDSEAGDVLAVTRNSETNAARLIALNADGTLNANLSIGDAASCDDIFMSAGNKLAFVINQNNQTAYEIDVEDGATAYHQHETFALSSVDVADMVVLHSAGESTHEHSSEEE